MFKYKNLFIKHVPELGFCAIIAIHSLKRGPALGGCRFLAYSSLKTALRDAAKLAEGMSYKAAISGLPYGGGKAVLLKPDTILNREAYFECFAEFVNQLQGNYITTVDSGLKIDDLNIIAKYTSFITGHCANNKVSGDPSPYTALGVIKGMEAAVMFKLNRMSLADLHVAVQGAGQVGYHLIKELYQQGAKITVCDVDEIAVQKCVAEFKIKTVPPDKIYSVPCDIFSPCALGGTLNEKTIPLLKTSIIAGCANNQLANTTAGFLLQDRNILYAPDYVINSGGLIKVASQYSATNSNDVNDRIAKIHATLYMIFKQSTNSITPTNIIADIMAKNMLDQ